MNLQHIARNAISGLALAVLLTACSSAYYGTMEKFGIEKRDIMVDRVEDARDAQDDASEQFTSALDQFRSAEVQLVVADVDEDAAAIQQRAHRTVEHVHAPIVDQLPHAGLGTGPGSYPRFGESQRSASATAQPFRRA